MIATHKQQHPSDDLSLLLMVCPNQLFNLQPSSLNQHLQLEPSTLSHSLNYQLEPSSETFNLEPWTLKASTLNYTLNPESLSKLWTPNLSLLTSLSIPNPQHKPSLTLNTNPQPSTLNTQPSTLNPQPSTNRISITSFDQPSTPTPLQNFQP